LQILRCACSTTPRPLRFLDPDGVHPGPEICPAEAGLYWHRSPRSGRKRVRDIKVEGIGQSGRRVGESCSVGVPRPRPNVSLTCTSFSATIRLYLRANTSGG
jgi:hypothetical protein